MRFIFRERYMQWIHNYWVECEQALPSEFNESGVCLFVCLFVWSYVMPYMCTHLYLHKSYVLPTEKCWWAIWPWISLRVQCTAPCVASWLCSTQDELVTMVLSKTRSSDGVTVHCGWCSGGQDTTKKGTRAPKMLVYTYSLSTVCSLPVSTVTALIVIAYFCPGFRHRLLST